MIHRIVRPLQRNHPWYSALVIVGWLFVVAGVAMVFLPAAVALAGGALFAVGWVGLGFGQ